MMFMARLFVEKLALPTLEPEEFPSTRYSDTLDYSITEDGEPYVLVGPHAATMTRTEVKQESDDVDPDPTVTITRVRQESDDHD